MDEGWEKIPEEERARLPVDGAENLDFYLNRNVFPFGSNMEISKKEREKIRKDIIDGAKEMNDFYLEETKAWNPLEEEVRLKFEAGLYDDPVVPQTPSA